ncbi:AAA family ATPase [Nocardia xishanensis]|uniref:AAA family ATPase n=1 Tax=Nocardia xishanensis TaxID=238964 RepID=A0ABW7X014_9NOCA
MREDYEQVDGRARVRERLRPVAEALGRRGLVLLCGFPASGKSTAAAYLSELCGAVVLDKDRFVPLLEETVLEALTGDRADRDSETYRTLISPGLYEGLIRTGLTVAAAAPVVLDAPFLSTIRSAHAAGRTLSDYVRGYPEAAPSIPIVTVWLDAPADGIKARMIARGADRDASKLAEWADYRSSVLESGTREKAYTACDVVIPS